MADKLDRIIGDYVNGNLEKQIQSRINNITFKIKYKSKVDNLGIRTAYKGSSEPERILLLKERIDRELDEDIILNELRQYKNALDIWWPSEDQLAKKALTIYYNKRWTWNGVAAELCADRSTIFRRIEGLKKRLSPYIIC